MIYTGYYSKIKEYVDSGLTLLSISRTKPEFAKSCIDIPQLFPSNKILWDHKKVKLMRWNIQVNIWINLMNLVLIE